MKESVSNIVVAGIVLFNPDVKRLLHNIQNISSQVEMVIFYNNGVAPEVVNRIKVQLGKKAIIVGDGNNHGIATALNGIMAKADELNYEWVLTLDQDSVVPENMISFFSRLMEQKDVAIVCPQNIDSRRKYMHPVLNPRIQDISMCDTSGSCTRVSIWKEIGKFDDWLFIDLVDNDYCKRVKLKGYRIIRVNSVIMDHQYGSLEPRSKCLERFFIRLGEMLHSTNIQKLSFKRKVSPLRVYYENRNILYLNKKYKKYGGIGYSNHHCKTYIGFFLTFSIYSWLVSDDKKAVFYAIRNGIKDSKKRKVEPWTIG